MKAEVVVLKSEIKASEIVKSDIVVTNNIMSFITLTYDTVFMIKLIESIESIIELEDSDV